MKKLILVLFFMVFPVYAAVDKTGTIENVQIWGGIAKTTLCSSDNNCQSFWVSLADTKGQSVLSMWLTAKVTQSALYMQGYAPDKSEHPYNNASRFYGMTLK